MENDTKQNYKIKTNPCPTKHHPSWVRRFNIKIHVQINEDKRTFKNHQMNSIVEN